MRHIRHRPVWTAILILSFGIPARSQSNQVWPELSTFVKLTNQMRFYFLATTVKENRKGTEGEYGPESDGFQVCWRGIFLALPQQTDS